MGGAVSTGRNNDDLVDNLLSADYIRTPGVEKLLRAVDRADYFLPQCKKNAYKDLAWKSGNLHMSAPCIYSEVMEGLCLKPNLSFLNLGSGTGYLSTMVGLAIGSGGINHGVEIYPDVIEYANRKLEEFKRYSSAIDEYDLCEPNFVQGNCLCLSSDVLLYDRVYCGGACPSAHINYMKNLIKIGGILVMPVDDQLMQIERTSENTWEDRSLLPVSFATLIMPETGSLEVVNAIDVQPLSLQELCRIVVRNVLRNNINNEFPNLKLLPKRRHVSKRKHPLKRTLIPHLDTSDEGSDEDEGQGDKDKNSEHSNNGIQSRSIGAFIDIVLGRIPDSRHSLFNASSSSTSSIPNASSDSIESDSKTNDENDSNHDSNSDSTLQENKNHELLEVLPKTSEVNTSVEKTSQNSQDRASSSSNGAVIARIVIRKRNRDDGIEDSIDESDEDCNAEDITNATTNKTKETETSSATKSKREKFDSGLGDEIISSSSEGETTNTEGEKSRMEVDSSSSSDEEDEQRNSTNESSEASLHSLRGRHWRTVTVPTYAVDHILGHLDDETPEEECETIAPLQPVIGPYTIHMNDKIQALPLPQTLKKYLNYYKEI